MPTPSKHDAREALNQTKRWADRAVPVLERICEMDPKKAFRIHHVIWRLADDFGFFEIHQNFAKNIVTGFIHMAGHVVGGVDYTNVNVGNGVADVTMRGEREHAAAAQERKERRKPFYGNL